MYVEPSNRVRSCTISYSLRVCVCVWMYVGALAFYANSTHPLSNSNRLTRTLAHTSNGAFKHTLDYAAVRSCGIHGRVRYPRISRVYVQRHSRVPDAHSLAAKSHLTIDALLPSCTRLHVYACLRVQASFCRHTETKKLTTTSERRVCARSRSR